MEFASPTLIIGLVLWFVGYIFIINALSVMGKISPKEQGLWNFTISSFMFVCIILIMVFQLFGTDSWLWAGMVFLFAFTYFGIGLNNLGGTDSRGLGWYCLLVAIVVPAIAEMNFRAGDVRFGLIWLIWGALWFTFWLIMGMGRTKLAGNMLGAIMLGVGVLTAWMPGYMMLRGWW